MNKKGFGAMGEAAVTKYFLERNYNVFKEFGDNSRIDLIAEKDGKLVRVQVKTTQSEKGVVKIDLQKSGPNGYKYQYTASDIDVFAIYVSDRDVTLFLPVSSSSQRNHNIRFEETKGPCGMKVRYAGDYLDFEGIA